jgi:hypothetical protein
MKSARYTDEQITFALHERSQRTFNLVTIARPA